MNNKFTTDVAKILIKDSLTKNQTVLCSPTLIDMSLRILAKDSNHRTLEELVRVQWDTVERKLALVLKGSNHKDGEHGDYGPVISYSDVMWMYSQGAWTVNNLFQADPVVEEGNYWAEEQTTRMIKQIINKEDDIKNDVVLLLANALYFKGTWQTTFHPEFTKDSDFHLLNGENIKLPFLNHYGKNFDYGKFEDCQVIRLPYKIGGNNNNPKRSFSMYIFLPIETNGLSNLIETIEIDCNMFDYSRFRLDSEVRLARVSIPKINLESDMSVKDSMKQLGLLLPFENTCKDFSSGFGVSDVVQKCRVETDDHGTTVSLECSQSGTWSPDPSSDNPVEFVADHPFMFVIREDHSGTLLFIGSMIGPQ